MVITIGWANIAVKFRALWFSWSDLIFERVYRNSKIYALKKLCSKLIGVIADLFGARMCDFVAVVDFWFYARTWRIFQPRVFRFLVVPNTQNYSVALMCTGGVIEETFFFSNFSYTKCVQTIVIDEKVSRMTRMGRLLLFSQPVRIQLIPGLNAGKGICTNDQM